MVVLVTEEPWKCATGKARSNETKWIIALQPVNKHLGVDYSSE